MSRPRHFPGRQPKRRYGDDRPGGTRMIGLTHYLAVAAALFVIGIFGIFLNRKNVIIILMSIELMLLAVNINFVAFSAFLARSGGAGLHHVRPDRRRRRGRHRSCDPRLFLPQPRHHRRRRRQRDERLRRTWTTIILSRAAGRRAHLRFRLAAHRRDGARWRSRPACCSWPACCPGSCSWASTADDAAHPYPRWIQSGTLDTDWAIRLDRLTAIMLIVVTTVSALVHLYSLRLHGP